MSLCIALKILMWLIIVLRTIACSERFFFSQNVIKIFITIFVGRRKIKLFCGFIHNFKTTVWFSFKPIKVWKLKMKALFVSLDQLVGLAEMSRGKTLALQLVAVFLHTI